MKVLITGKNGQLGFELRASAPTGVNLYAFDSKELNISDTDAVIKKVSEIKPDVIINAAAYTAVDKAESDHAAAYSVNETGVKNLAKAAKEIGSRLVHISTDFVFDATKNTWYMPEDKTYPLGVYGASKLAGEQAVLAEDPEHSTIIRTSWVYSANGNNFVKTMLKLMSEREELSVVADQIGTPTWAKGLAQVCWKVALKGSVDELYHWSDLGTASWYDFAVAIQEIGLELGILRKEIPVKPIRASQYPTPATRPVYSVMDTTKIREEFEIEGLHWRKALKEMMKELL
jgi:dTDP-4-dehydrorhamnose reductase